MRSLSDLNPDLALLSPVPHVRKRLARRVRKGGDRQPQRVPESRPEPEVNPFHVGAVEGVDRYGLCLAANVFSCRYGGGIGREKGGNQAKFESRLKS